MIYLYCYFSIGVVVLAIAYGAHRLTEEKESEFVRDVLEGVNPNRKRPSYRILNGIVVPLLAALLLVAVWPMALYIKVREMLQKKDGIESEKEREFAVERQHLQECLTVQEVERREFVTDPLKAVPELPFGHLNAAWEEFFNGHADGAELWSFTALWQTTWGHKELRSGYVVVQDGAPGAHFLTVRKDILDEADGGTQQARVVDLPG